MINNPIHTKSAHLIWQSPLDGAGSRRRLPVALLRAKEDGSVTFSYLKDSSSFEKARSEGFEGYYGIPLDREDTTDAIHTLGRRLLNSDRPDYADYLARFGLLPEYSLPTLSLLAYTGGRQVSDSFSFADTFEGFDRPFQYIFDVAGRRHSFDLTPEVFAGDFAEFRADPANEHDQNAVEIVDLNGNRFGYVNTCHAEIVRHWLIHGSFNAKVFRVNGRPSYPKLFVVAEINPSGH
ncbi:MAG: hypothetical protein HRU33_00535 [Rhodobacteraceae bacterium]|nr:hypothetical protein [Paracoccaceae bacterium]